MSQAWQASEGAGVTVAVLSTGVASGHPDLAGEVITGPDYTGSGRSENGPFWGGEGTAVASVIAGTGMVTATTQASLVSPLRRKYSPSR